MRRGIRLWAIAWVGLQALPAASMDGPAPADRPVRLAMPYTCAIDKGALVVRPGPERVFAVTGNREERLFTTCDPPFSSNCRSLIVHKFEVVCGLDRVSWPRLVAAIGTLQDLYASAKDDGDPAALEEWLEPLQSAARV